jgi:hypothetical protein
MPDGQVLPFCTFNVFPEVYRDKAQKQYSIPTSEWQKTHPGWTYPKDKYMRNTKEIEATALYQKTYGSMIDYFALGINGGRPVKNFSNPAVKSVVPPIVQKAVVVQTASAAGPKTMEVTAGYSAKESPKEDADSCGCGKGGCNCGKGGKGGDCGCGSGGACDC